MFSGLFRSRNTPNKRKEYLLGFLRSDEGECMVCCNDAGPLYSLPSCSHQGCAECWLSHVINRIETYKMNSMTCLACDEDLSYNNVQYIFHELPGFNDEKDKYNLFDRTISKKDCDVLLERLGKFLLTQYLVKEPNLRWCPNGCGFGVITKDRKKCPRIECMSEHCRGTAFCFNCRQRMSDNHRCGEEPPPPPLAMNADGLGAARNLYNSIRRQVSGDQANNEQYDPDLLPAVTPQFRLEYQESLRQFSNESNNPDEIEAVDDNDVANNWADKDSTNEAKEEEKIEMKDCPKCKTSVVKIKDGSCNHMKCSICGCEFCWLCQKEYGYAHFMLPTGCGMYAEGRWPLIGRIGIFFAVFLLGVPAVLLVAFLLSIGVVIYLILLSVLPICYSLKKEIVPVYVYSFGLLILLSLVIVPIVIVTLFTLLTIIGILAVYLILPISKISQYLAARRRAQESRFWTRPEDNNNEGNNNNEVEA